MIPEIPIDDPICAIGIGQRDSIHIHLPAVCQQADLNSGSITGCGKGVANILPITGAALLCPGACQNRHTALAVIQLDHRGQLCAFAGDPRHIRQGVFPVGFHGYRLLCFQDIAGARLDPHSRTAVYTCAGYLLHRADAAGLHGIKAGRIRAVGTQFKIAVGDDVLGVALFHNGEVVHIHLTAVYDQIDLDGRGFPIHGHIIAHRLPVIHRPGYDTPRLPLGFPGIGAAQRGTAEMDLQPGFSRLAKSLDLIGDGVGLRRLHCPCAAVQGIGMGAQVHIMIRQNGNAGAGIGKCIFGHKLVNRIIP